MAVGDVYRWTARGTYQGQTCMVTGHAEENAAALPSVIEGLLRTWIVADLIPIMAAEQVKTFAWNRAIVQKIWPLPVWVASEEAVTTEGALDELGMPSEVAAVLQRRTVIAAKAQRGRIFLPGMPASALDPTNGLWTAAKRGALHTVAQQLYGTVGPGGVGGQLEHVLYSRSTHLTVTLTQAGANEAPRVQRRRQPGRGI